MSRAHFVLGFLQVSLLFLHFSLPPSASSKGSSSSPAAASGGKKGDSSASESSGGSPGDGEAVCSPVPTAGEESRTRSSRVQRSGTTSSGKGRGKELEDDVSAAETSSERSQRRCRGGGSRYHSCEASIVEGGGGTGSAVCLNNKRTTLGNAKIHASLSSSHSGGGGLALTVPHALAPIDQKTNRVHVPRSIKRLLVDIGTYLTSPTSMWHGWTEPETFVVGIDANPWTAVIMKYFGTKGFTANAANYFPDAAPGSGAGGPGCDAAALARCFSHGWYWWKNKTDRQIMIHSAMMDKTKGTQPTGGTFAYFHPGMPNRSDTGSIFEFKSSQLSKMRMKSESLPKPAIAPLLTLAEVLKYLPSPSGLGRPRLPLAVKGGSMVPDKHQLYVNTRFASSSSEGESSSFSIFDPAFTAQAPKGVLASTRDLQWDTLKIDAQGADILVLLGGVPEKSKVHSLLERFVCIIGEFDESSYQTSGTDYMAKVKTGKGGKTVDAALILQKFGFIRLDKMVFVNSRFLHLFWKGPQYYTCEANDVHREHRYFIMKLKRFGFTEKGYDCVMSGETDCSPKRLNQ